MGSQTISQDQISPGLARALVVMLPFSLAFWASIGALLF